MGWGGRGCYSPLLSLLELNCMPFSLPENIFRSRAMVVDIIKDRVFVDVIKWKQGCPGLG